MRPAWLEEMIVGLETDFYDSLKKTDIAEKTINKYPDQTIEELAETLSKGMDQGRCGDHARALCEGDNLIPNYDKLCKEAFKKVMIRLLSEAAGRVTK